MYRYYESNHMNGGAICLGSEGTARFCRRTGACTVSLKEKIEAILVFMLRSLIRSIRRTKRKTIKSLRILAREMAAAKAERKSFSFVKRAYSSLPAFSSTVTVAVTLFTFFAAVAAAERGAWGMIGGEIFLVVAGTSLFRRFVSKFI